MYRTKVSAGVSSMFPRAECNGKQGRIQKNYGRVDSFLWYSDWSVAEYLNFSPCYV